MLLNELCTKPKIGYDQNGNTDTLVRYGTNATLTDNLKYHYLANSNRSGHFRSSSTLYMTTAGQTTASKNPSTPPQNDWAC